VVEWSNGPDSKSGVGVTEPLRVSRRLVGFNHATAESLLLASGQS
jgi:hypothetical protein